MYSKHCHFVLENGGEEILVAKLHHLPVPDTMVKITPKSTGVETTYKVQKVTLVMAEITVTYPPPPGGFNVRWENKWVIEVSIVV